MKNNSKNISIIFLVFSIFLLAYLFYLSEIQYSGTKKNYFLIYYYISYALIILSIISFFINKETKYKIILVLIFIIFGLYVVEFFIQKKFFSINKRNFNNLSIKYDNRTKSKVYNDEKLYEPDIAVVIPPGTFLNDTDTKLRPLSGISNKKTIHCNENGYYSIYQSDQYGFNNPNSEWNKEQIEFLLIGDSFVHGNCVNEPDTIGGNLKKKTKK